MSSRSKDEVVETALARIPRVADGIAAMPPEKHSAAFGIAEQAYLEAALQLDYPEEVAKNWVSAVMFRLRAEVEKRQRGALKTAG